MPDVDLRITVLRNILRSDITMNKLMETHLPSLIEAISKEALDAGTMARLIKKDCEERGVEESLWTTKVWSNRKELGTVYEVSAAVDIDADGVGGSDKFLKISFNIQGKSTRILHVKSDIKIKALKKTIWKIVGIPIRCQALFHQGVCMDDKKRLVDYYVRSGDSITMLSSLKGGSHFEEWNWRSSWIVISLMFTWLSSKVSNVFRKVKQYFSKDDLLRDLIFKEIARIGHDFAFGKSPGAIFNRFTETLPVLFTLQDDVGDTPLNNAILKGNMHQATCILNILSKHCPWALDLPNTNGHTALILAPACDVPASFVSKLLTAGCSLDKYDDRDKSSLSYALEYQNTEALRILLDYVKNHKLESVLVKRDCDNFTLLQKATALGYLEGAKMIADLENHDYDFIIPVNEPMQDAGTSSLSLEKQSLENIVVQGEKDESNDATSEDAYNDYNLTHEKCYLLNSKWGIPTERYW